MMTLAEALKSGRLAEFIQQEKERGIGPIAQAEFDGAIASIVKPKQSKGRTSRSASRGGSTGTKTR
jgi:hypothetical protein